jgi:pyrroloquinoline quinone (PQQ) biosynthesis protein C
MPDAVRRIFRRGALSKKIGGAACASKIGRWTMGGMRVEFSRTGPLTELGSYPDWAQDIVHSAENAKRKVVSHELFFMMREDSLPPSTIHRFLMAGWPVIEQFPQYMATNIRKIRYGRSRGEDMARRYLLRNMRIEQNHADHWVEWAEASGLARETLLHTEMPPENHALNHWCWHCCERNSLASSMAATNYAIEGATGEWSALVCSSDKYIDSFDEGVRRKATRWLKLHAHYDDTHPWEALDIICTLIGTVADPQYVEFLGSSIRKSYDYMTMSLDKCLMPDADVH